MDDTEDEYANIRKNNHTEMTQVFQVNIKEDDIEEHMEEIKEEYHEELESFKKCNNKNLNIFENDFLTVNIKEEPVTYFENSNVKTCSNLQYYDNEDTLKTNVLCDKSSSSDQSYSVSNHKEYKCKKYVRKSNWQTWSQDSMITAVKEVMSGHMGYLKASKMFGVPIKSLQRRVKKAKNGFTAEDASRKGLGNYRPVFTSEQEKELVNYILLMKSRSLRLTQLEIRRIAYELAEKKNLKHNFNSVKKSAGKAWLYSFLERHPEVMQTAESESLTSINQAMKLNKPSVNYFFTELSSLFKIYNFSPDRIYNADKILVRTASQSNVLILREKHIEDLVSAENGVLVTAITCINAIGNYMPTMFVFPCHSDNPSLSEDAPPGSTAEFHPSGLVQKEIFMKWFQHFVEFSNVSAEKPILLLLDGHATCTKSIELIEEARKSNVHLMFFPPDCAHHMQPLEVAFITLVRQYYSQEINKWLCSHPEQDVTIDQVGKLYGAAFMKAASVETAVIGFRITGIYPLNPSVFPDWMFDLSKCNEILPDSEGDLNARTNNMEMDEQINCQFQEDFSI